MLQLFKIAVTAFLLVAWIPPSSANAGDASSTGPITNHGKKWRIGYLEGGSYINYPINLRAIAAGLAELGWMEPVTIPAAADQTRSKPVWDYLAGHVSSAYIQFVADGHWSAGWDSERRKLTKELIIRRLNQNKDIDFMIAMGTWAGQDLANNRHRIPTMAVSVSDPVGAGISASAEDSGLDHIHARCDPTRYIRQLRLFHRIVNFNKMGFVYENSVEGRTYAAFDSINQVARERNFEVLSCEAPWSDVDLDISTNQVIRCNEELSRKVDAVFITVHRGINPKRMHAVVAPFLAHKIPTWSQRGPEEVKMGVLFSISRGGFNAVGRFHAEVMARIFNGEKPRRIPQIFEDPKLIAVNTKVAQAIGFRIPDSVMRIADVVYDSIEQ